MSSGEGKWCNWHEVIDVDCGRHRSKFRPWIVSEVKGSGIALGGSASPISLMVGGREWVRPRGGTVAVATKDVNLKCGRIGSCDVNNPCDEKFRVAGPFGAIRCG